VTAIDFLYRGAPFSGETMRRASLGGIESSIVQLAEALAARGHDVTVFNSIPAPAYEFGVQWRPLAEASQRARGEIGIAVASPKAFDGTSFRTRIFWLHNPIRSWQQIRRGNVWPFMKTRPLFVLLGEYHKKHVPRWLPSSGRTIVHHGIQEDFFRGEPLSEPPPPHALFTSQPYRGLDWLLDLWGEIKRQVPAATFDVFAPKPHQAAANAAKSAAEGVSFRGSISRAGLVQELGTARVQLIPGHRDETYCLAAAEAIAAGVPVVTMGIGSLPERVRDGVNGFIARSKDEFIVRTVALLSDNGLWRAMHQQCLSDPALSTWDERAKEWEALFTRLEKFGSQGRGKE
jgi:glycosyltransferase involved in cell wall biosynthesis